MRKRLREGSGEGNVLVLERLQVRCDREDRVKAQQWTRGGRCAHKIDARISDEALGARQRICECLRLPRVDA